MVRYLMIIIGFIGIEGMQTLQAKLEGKLEILILE